MFTCRELVELLCEFIEGELPDDKHQLIEEHLGRCPPCAVYVETYLLTITMSRQLPCSPLPPQLAQRLRETMAEMNKQSEGQMKENE
jgi:anti-sigma factor RsiW